MKPVEKKQAAGMLKQMIDNHNCIIEAINKDYPIIYEGMPNEVCVSDIVEWVETQTKMKTQAELIDKACELLSVNLVHLGLFTNESIADFIINFKNAMGGWE